LSYENQTVEKCDSTNNLAKSLAEQGAPHGTWVSARIQEAGRGRLGRNWQSLEGNLFLSLVTRIEDKRLWSWIPLATAIGIIDHLRKRFPTLGISPLEVLVKWPNDIYLNGRKLGGILCESVGGPKSFVIIGIGLNCVASPNDPELNAVDLTTMLSGQKITADDIRLELVDSVLCKLNDLMSKGPKTIANYYRKWALLKPGTKIEWDQGRKSGSVNDLGPSGELEVLTDQETLLSLFAEDVSIFKRRSPEDREDPGAS
jgi:BirA family biotin operon repressor/biotin-[acetyl-CoA-carboxylase] ligase